MLKKIFLFFCLLFCSGAYAGPMVNVEYIHDLIKNQWGITVPYNPALSDKTVAANMKYLLTAIDRANEILNGKPTTDYGNDEKYATLAAADTVATNEATDRLINLESKFFVTTTPDTNEFSFSLAASGTFQVNWGDGTTEHIVQTDTAPTKYSHKYADARARTIEFGSLPKRYYNAAYTAAISFAGNLNVAGISGSLGALLPTLGPAATQSPRFYATFSGCKNLTGKIPENLFTGISSNPGYMMFHSTFSGCSGLTGTIPPKLFAGIQGAPDQFTFNSTFQGCSGLTGSIPGDLFVGVKGAPTSQLFWGTFDGCSGLTGQIPADLFAGISGVVVGHAFRETFRNCTGLTGPLPAGLFRGLRGKFVAGGFPSTFGGDTGLTGCVPDDFFGDIDATLDEIIKNDNPFSGSGITQTSCSALTPKFFVTTTDDTSEFKFDMSAKGIFQIDWGDGKTEYVTRTNTTNKTYSHEYTVPGKYEIGIGGYATGYNIATGSNTFPAISFAGTTVESNVHLAKIDGSLGALFPTLGDGTQPGEQPKFNRTFASCTKLGGAIPENLFAGIKGAPVSAMFYNTFSLCSGLTGKIPNGLFSGLSGDIQSYTFSYTFNGCIGLTGEIPENLFGNLTGTPQEKMFDSTFSGCRGLTGQIPPKLFSNISGNLQRYFVFHNTFANTGLTGCVPDDLFAKIDATLDKIIADNDPFSGSGVTQQLCPVTE